MSTYVVAGVTGKVGGVVAAELLSHGQRVRGIARDAARAAEWAAGGGEAAVGSLEDAAFLTRTLEGAAGCFVLLPEDPFALAVVAAPPQRAAVRSGISVGTSAPPCGAE